MSRFEEHSGSKLRRPWGSIYVVETGITLKQYKDGPLIEDDQNPPIKKKEKRKNKGVEGRKPKSKEIEKK